MGYSISEVAEMVGMKPSTIRYYEKRGLLPDIDRTESGIRSFSEQDVIVLKLIRSLKKCGLSIEDIGRFSKLFRQEGDRYAEQYEILRSHVQELDQAIEAMQQMREILEFHCWYNKRAAERGNVAELRKMEADDIPQRMKDLNDKYNLVVKF